MFERLFPRWSVALYRSADAHEVPRAASAMAFDLFLGLMPLLALLGWLAGWLAHHSPALIDVRLVDLAPGPAATIARNQFKLLEGAGESLAPYAMAGFFWLASGSAHVALGTVRKIAGLPDRGYVRTRLLAFAFTLGALLFTIASSTAVFMVQTLASVGHLTEAAARVWNELLAGLTLLGAFVGVASVYRIATGSNGRGLAVVPGAIVAVVGFAGVSAAFSLYVARLARYAAFYGALASVTVLLIWLWLSSLALLVGAEVNALVSRRRSERG